MLREAPTIMAQTKAQMTKQEKEWRAQDDARTLATAEVVKNDPPRLSAAKVAAKRMAEEEKDSAKAMTRVAGIRKANTLSNDKDEGEGAKKKAKRAKPKNTHNVFNRI
jgi:hypothetical protein